MWRDLWATHRRGIIAVITAVVLLACALAWVAVWPHQTGQHATPPPAAGATAMASAAEGTFAVGQTAPRSDAAGAAGLGPADTSPPTAAAGYDHAAWDAIPAVTPATTTAYPPIQANLRTQPDTFVTAFGTELLTRNYATSGRTQLLSWAQSEAAPLTITQVPLSTADRNKALIVSLTSPDWDGAPSTLVPSAADWSALVSLHARTTVTDVKVETVLDFPPANVTFTDPLTLARLFTATLTVRTTVGGQSVTSTSSVSFQVVLGTSLHHGRVFGAAATQHFVKRGQS